jgi:NADH-quinone oxidoreductase subunit L
MAAPSIPAMLAATFRPIYLLLLNKYYVDEIYDALLVRPSMALARVLWQVGDATIIDGVPNGIAALAQDGSSQVVKLQTGSIAVYAFAMLIGLVVLSCIVLLLLVV